MVSETQESLECNMRRVELMTQDKYHIHTQNTSI